MEFNIINELLKIKKIENPIEIKNFLESLGFPYVESYGTRNAKFDYASADYWDDDIYIKLDISNKEDLTKDSLDYKMSWPTDMYGNILDFNDTVYDRIHDCTFKIKDFKIKKYWNKLYWYAENDKLSVKLTDCRKVKK